MSASDLRNVIYDVDDRVWEGSDWGSPREQFHQVPDVQHNAAGFSVFFSGIHFGTFPFFFLLYLISPFWNVNAYLVSLHIKTI